ncbi:hypothetical protein ACO22_04913 [Paracoccidioides brasiliensis]|uniref:Uncharacterized protein n=1 Tax=Paracoccidioides brasiliensis TaxID=121759 RepID=A0A1D2JBQ8_PARBR|nr:hypothetical protein ACO22_04913 [Paracoccidioides brasiliensis]
MVLNGDCEEVPSCSGSDAEERPPRIGRFLNPTADDWPSLSLGLVRKKSNQIKPPTSATKPGLAAKIFTSFNPCTREDQTNDDKDPGIALLCITVLEDQSLLNLDLRLWSYFS